MSRPDSSGDELAAPRRSPSVELASDLLLPVSWLYGRAASWRRRRRARQATRLDVPVVSVGNLTVGGTGKTPVVELVVRLALEQGRRPAVLSRGYRAAPRSGGRNDEVLLLERNLPEVLQVPDPSRVRGGRRAMAEGADLLVLDDGFQHVLLARDLDIVLVDALNPFGYGRVLPSGLLREPIEALEQADLILITRGQNVSRRDLGLLRTFLSWRFPRARRGEVAFEPRELVSLGEPAPRPVDTLRGRRVVAFAAVGNPEAFRRDLADLGADVVDWLTFRDHHAYTSSDVERIEERARSRDVDAVVFTQKDAVKLEPLITRENPAAVVDASRWSYVRIVARMSRGEETLREQLEKTLAAR